MSRSSFSKDEKIAILKLLNEDNYSVNHLASMYNVDWSTIRSWQHKYETFGVDGLRESEKWKSYSKELKIAAVHDYISGEYSLREIIRKYDIASDSSLRKWIKEYNSHRELKDTGKGKSGSMTKGRNTTLNERIEIVLYCLEQNKNYQLAAETYEVSYHQVYQWVKKYEVGGEGALKDQRGRTKEEQELTPEEKFNLKMKRLERENERLRAENLFFKKVRGNRKEAKVSQIRFEDKYIAIQELHKGENLSIILLCEIAGISRAAYYKWLNRAPSTKELQNEEIIKEMKALHEKVDSSFGYRQMTLHMNRKFKEKINHKRIYRLMKISKLRSVIRVKKKQYKHSPPQHVAENVLNRQFTAEKPNNKWVTDVTEFKYGRSKKAYLSAIRDLYDGSIVSYVLGHSNNNQLVFKTLEQAISILTVERPIIHSDRGFQYTSHGFKRRIDAAKMTQSMSRVGRCIDNSPMESFWSTLKCEKYYLSKYETFEELSFAIDEYIHFYNHNRYQKRLNGLSPIEYRTKAA
ncbi:IS3 family transposase [Cytobacillus depressus]|uniref:IS3 family transposase n=1 Tax=Cytobacillus depressus TaxID=1602942 RepID=A0A6L3V673_9BACI|nr:IS3 family transposase [Cytobacillus depressus]KAB2336749.1 IS3 family transposase [Cytobacillus depressus]